MREIVLDTETTGLDPAKGHRIIEIGCVELLNAIPTGQTFHVYIDPERDIPEEAFRVHGISSEFLAGKPVFSQISADFLNFLGDGKIVAHNAEFDLRFLNAELALLEIAAIGQDRVIDTLALARRKYPGAGNSLDALCARYGIDASRRTKHGALLDAEILAEVYAELTGGRQAALVFAGGQRASEAATGALLVQRPKPCPSALSEEELAAHAAFVAGLGAKAIWSHYQSLAAAAE
ncbi:DNA polymerase III subunit epsilon [Methylocapsa polymorpha]|uniref:DNA polymerase III subunit epsilon n=1 Tax=Methylocapsa polymorpha TaxID=3080828 RepID=A0ABZ0HWR2_9HYPH|nr:DNA polymerase III subunit epsilon [Methylocapsa sp. RX1]